MNRPIDPDLDGLPNVKALSRESLERGLRYTVHQLAEERTENRKLRKALAAAGIDPGGPKGCAACDRGDYQLGHADWCPKQQSHE